MRGWWAPFAIDKGWGKCRTGGLLVADLAEAQDYAELRSAGSTGKAKGACGQRLPPTHRQPGRQAGGRHGMVWICFASLRARQRSGRWDALQQTSDRTGPRCARANSLVQEFAGRRGLSTGRDAARP